MELSAIACRAADLLFEDFRRARFVQGGLLRGECLTDGADARVAVDGHETSDFARMLRS
jgi:hypothetical protein